MKVELFPRLSSINSVVHQFSANINSEIIAKTNENFYRKKGRVEIGTSANTVEISEFVGAKKVFQVCVCCGGRSWCPLSNYFVLLIQNYIRL